mgnify:FL=1
MILMLTGCRNVAFSARISRFGNVTVFTSDISDVILDIIDDITTANAVLILHKGGLDRMFDNGSKEILINSTGRLR